MRKLWRDRQADVAQVEYTYLASYGGDILVEHDVTFDLYAQVRARRQNIHRVVGLVALAVASNCGPSGATSKS